MLVSNNQKLRVVFVTLNPRGAQLHVTEKTTISDAAQLIQSNVAFLNQCTHVYFLKPHQRSDITRNRLKQLPHLIFNEKAYGDKPRREDQVINGDYTELSEMLAYQRFLALTQEMLPDKRFYQKREKTYHQQVPHPHG